MTPDFTAPTFSSHLTNGYFDPGNFTVNQGQFLSFGGTASDGVGLSVITVKVSSPKVTDYTVSTASVSGTSKSLSAYGFDTGNSTYAGVGGSYTVTIFAKDSSNNVSFRTWNFTVVTPDFTVPTFSVAALNGVFRSGQLHGEPGSVPLLRRHRVRRRRAVGDHSQGQQSQGDRLHGQHRLGERHQQVAFGLRFRHGQRHVRRGRRQLHRHDLRQGFLEQRLLQDLELHRRDAQHHGAMFRARSAERRFQSRATSR